MFELDRDIVSAVSLFSSGPQNDQSISLHRANNLHFASTHTDRQLDNRKLSLRTGRAVQRNSQ